MSKRRLTTQQKQALEDVRNGQSLIATVSTSNSQARGRRLTLRSLVRRKLVRQEVRDDGLHYVPNFEAECFTMYHKDFQLISRWGFLQVLSPSHTVVASTTHAITRPDERDRIYGVWRQVMAETLPDFEKMLNP